MRACDFNGLCDLYVSAGREDVAERLDHEATVLLRMGYAWEELVISSRRGDPDATQVVPASTVTPVTATTRRRPAA